MIPINDMNRTRSVSSTIECTHWRYHCNL